MRTYLRKSHGMEPNFVPNSTVSICRVPEGINAVCVGQNLNFVERCQFGLSVTYFPDKCPAVWGLRAGSYIPWIVSAKPR